MNEQKENDLMLNMSPIIKHQIDAEDDNRKFEHMYYKSMKFIKVI